MVTGTKARGWPLMANCILHSSFVNCCLPSSHFLLGHGTKPRTGGIRNGTSASPMHNQALSTSFSPSLSFSRFLSVSLSLFLSPQSRTSFYLLLTVCTPMTSESPSFLLYLSFFLHMRSSLVYSHLCDVGLILASLPTTLSQLATQIQ